MATNGTTRGQGVMVLCSNDSSRAFCALARESGRLGWLLGPRHYKNPRPDIPFALDNDAYICWKKGEDFNVQAWTKMLSKVQSSGATPLWVLVPDAVGDKVLTLHYWRKFSPAARDYGWPLAFAAQDGMVGRDIPKTADVVFIGGSTQWKWRTLPDWCQHFPRVHLARCGTSRWKLERLEDLGVESCDGSGFFRATIGGREGRQLLGWLHTTESQHDLFAQ